MAKEKKFGTFQGVFTPSILTILGVIMYMRLSWVVGQAGIVGTLAIILIAHIISVTTGLSISSIATDKKIKAGGIYYILSRSLGLPMGGAIGIALFIGTALSISLYIVGFSENFLSIEPISNFLNLEPNLNSYRIVGTAIIIILVIIAFISTSLALKTQYFVLGAIILSLISITVGFKVNPEFAAASPNFFKAQNGLSFEEVFAVFFPAVTGFTAGVAMSGDLKDPKKNIPFGSLLAIGVGFIVYVSLTIGLGFFVNRNDLLKDNNLAMHIAWIPALVVAGIWGATLSSALGGILGGPRILQALSKDRVTPKIFAKSYGKNNEPRNALIMIFIIAEAGIMIGNLNVIASVVTMFFLTSYGFINLAYFLENWASTDFRPSFKVSSIYGIIGFVFAFAIMFKLDVISMLVAFVIIGLIYFLLQRKQLKLDYGDVWQSVWISVVRRGLHKLDSNSIEDRNWQPNIILFSGGQDKRPHLIEFGKSLVGKFGFLSNFDLKVDKDADVLFPKHKQAIPQKNKIGVFSRRQSCKDIYKGIEMIVRTYGFSGIEPNTTVMGWGRQSHNPKKLVKLINTINNLDYNLLLVDYEPINGYGNYKQIDIWWRGAGNNGNFALTIAKFMLASEKWENAKIRLMIVNNEDSKAFYIYRRAKEILENMRLSAEVKIINNELEKKPFYNIIRTESKKADIIFIGIPSVQTGEEEKFVKKTNKLLHKIGTVVLLKASSLFKELNLGVNIEQKSIISASDNLNLVKKIANDLINSRHESLNKIIRNNFEGVIKIYDKTIATYTFKEVDEFILILENYKNLTDDIFCLLKENLKKLNYNDRKEYILRYQDTLIKKINKEFESFKNNQLIELNEMMLDVLFDYQLQMNNFFDNIKSDAILTFKRKEFKIRTSDKLKFRFFKFYYRLINNKKEKISIVFPPKYRINTITPSLYEVLSRQIEQIRIETLRFIYLFDEVVLKLVYSLNDLKKPANNKNISIEQIQEIENKFNENYNQLKEKTNNIVLKVTKNRKYILLRVLNKFLNNSNNLKTFYHNREKKLKSKKIKHLEDNIDTKKDILFSSFKLFINYIQFQNRIKSLDLKIINIIENLHLQTDKIITQNIEKPLKNNTKINFNNFEKTIKLKLDSSILEINNGLDNLPKSIKIMELDSLNDSFYKNFENLKKINIPLPDVLDLILNENIYKSLKNTFSLLSENIKSILDDNKTKNKHLKILKIKKDFISEIKEITNEISVLKIHKIIDKVVKK